MRRASVDTGQGLWFKLYLIWSRILYLACLFFTYDEELAKFEGKIMKPLINSKSKVIFAILQADTWYSGQGVIFEIVLSLIKP